MKIRRTYPQPDSPQPGLGPRERALAVFKYLLDLEPEAAVLHPLFACIRHSYEQAGAVATLRWARETVFVEIDENGDEMQSTPAEVCEYSLPRVQPSLVPELTSERIVPDPIVVTGNGDGGL